MRTLLLACAMLASPLVHADTSTGALEPLRKLLKSPELVTLKSEYKGSTWDVGSYGFSLHDGAGKMRTVSTSMLAVGELPPLLQQIIGEARKLSGNLYRTP